MKLSSRMLSVLGVQLLLCGAWSGCNQSGNSSRTTSAPPSPAQSGQQSHRRLLVIIGGKNGYVDETGKLVINPQWDLAYAFSEGLAAVCVGNCDLDHQTGYRFTKDFERVNIEQTFKYGFINEDGKLVINPAYEHISEFSEGLAAVCVGRGCYHNPYSESKDKKWGYIDKQGTMAVPPQFDTAQAFHEGLAVVSVFVINPQYWMAFQFENGIASVATKSADTNAHAKFGYIDKTGKEIWPPSS